MSSDASKPRDEIIDEANRMGFNSILLKPFTSDELRGTVEKVLADLA